MIEVSPIIVLLVIAVIILVTVLVIIVWRSPARLGRAFFTGKWRAIQGMCKDKTLWADAINKSDELLELALKKRRYKGKTTGERMVAAQRVFSNNDSLWYAHNLSKKIREEGVARLKESEVKDALVGFRQALKDLGVLDNGEPRN